LSLRCSALFVVARAGPPSCSRLQEFLRHGR
jgi:hypothetical protein